MKKGGIHEPISQTIDAQLAKSKNQTRLHSSNVVLLNSEIPYFETNSTGRHPGQYTQLKLLPPECGPHQFENTLL